MKPAAPAVLASLWFGAALSALFFYPLLQALDGDVYYLFWQRHDTLEFGVSFVLVALLLAAAWYALSRVRSPRLQLAGILLLAVIPLTSCAVAIMRQLPLKERLIPLMARTDVRLGIIVVAGALGIWAIAMAPRAVLAIVRGALLVVRPVVLIVVVTFVRIAGDEGLPHAASVQGKATSSSAGSSVFVFLFDELSYRFVYRDNAPRADLPNLRRFDDRATNYVAAQAPGENTITSVPGLLRGEPYAGVDAKGDELYEVLPNGKRLVLNLSGSTNLFARAKAAGYRTEIVGFYFPYCRLLSGVADACQSFSYYNYSNVASGFSPLNPILTTFILWPYQQPFGLLKVPVFGRLHRAILARIVEAATADLDPARRTFRFVHLPIPHLPFVFDQSGYNPGDDPMRQDAENYERQLQYTDQVVGRLVDALTSGGVFENSTVVIMSDHEYRWSKMIPAEASHIPLIVKHPGQTARETVTEPVRAEQILADLVTVR
jgi:hypothetical protein